MAGLITRQVVNIPLRPGKDDDIYAALCAMPASVEKSDIGRAALRMWFGLNREQDQLLLPLPGAVTKVREDEPKVVKKPAEKRKPASLEPITEQRTEKAGESPTMDLNDDFGNYLNTFSTG